MMSIGGVAVANHFSVDPCSPLFCVFQILEDENSSALAHYKTVSLFIERTRGVLWIAVASAHRAHRTEASDADGDDGGLSPTRHHDFGIAHFYSTPRFSESVVAGSASGAGSKIWPAQIQ